MISEGDANPRKQHLRPVGKGGGAEEGRGPPSASQGVLRRSRAPAIGQKQENSSPGQMGGRTGLRQSPGGGRLQKQAETPSQNCVPSGARAQGRGAATRGSPAPILGPDALHPHGRCVHPPGRCVHPHGRCVHPHGRCVRGSAPAPLARITGTASYESFYLRFCSSPPELTRVTATGVTF